MELLQKEVQKDERIQEICLEKTYSQKASVRRNIISIKGQRKAFYRQIIPEPGCVKKKLLT